MLGNIELSASPIEAPVLKFLIVDSWSFLLLAPKCHTHIASGGLMHKHMQGCP